jgi:hypothetical protein
MPVKIPPYFANFVEYDGDPGWGEKRKGQRPVRTYQSKIRSFGFDVRYPDMAALSSEKMYSDKSSKSIYRTDWMGVVITSGEYFGNGLFLEYMVTHMNELRSFNYIKKKEKENDLEIYFPVEKNNLKIPKKDSEDFFVHRDVLGKVDAFITCSNVEHAAAPCQHYFIIPNIKVNITLHYRRGFLPEWKKIQFSINQLVMSFKEIKP